MPLSKSAILLCSSNSLHNVAPIPPSITSSSFGRRSRSQPQPQPQPQPPHSYPQPQPSSQSRLQPRLHLHLPQCRRYASSSAKHSHNAVPEWPKAAYPTPYDIFAMAKDAPYTKKRFYELVKFYHPDKHTHAAAQHRIPHATCLERYRLIVAANDLLSDPDKRRLYDVHGIGWTGGRPQSLNDSVREADRAWRHQPGSAAHNATWEDWERWYDSRSGKARDPNYMSNGLFASLVVVMCMIGALAQANRASESGVEYMEMRNQANQAIGMQIAKTTQAAHGMSKDQRVDSFLRERENVAYQFVPGRYDSYDPERDREA